MHRWIAWSEDGGMTWKHPAQSALLPDAAAGCGRFNGAKLDTALSGVGRRIDEKDVAGLGYELGQFRGELGKRKGSHLGPVLQCDCRCGAWAGGVITKEFVAVADDQDGCHGRRSGDLFAAAVKLARGE